MNTDNFWTDEKVKDLLRKVTSYAAPEHWQNEIDHFKKSKQVSKDKDYEILSVEYGNNNWTCNKGSFEWYLKNAGKISQVKRLEDNEVFTVGDSVMWKMDGWSKEPFTITSFQENDILPQNRMFCNNQNVDITYLKKVSKPIPLFTTEQESYIRVIVKRVLNEIVK